MDEEVLEDMIMAKIIQGWEHGSSSRHTNGSSRILETI
jgi:hypothetical protein